MSDGDDISGSIGEGFKKTGKSLISQITGSDPNSQQSTTLDPADQIGGFGKSFLGQITGSAPSSGQPQTQDAAGQLGGFGKSILGQVTGGDTSGEPDGPKPVVDDEGFLGGLKAFGASILGQVTGEDLERMKKKDDDFSQASQAQVRAKIQRIYQEHAQKRKQEGQYVQQQQKQTEEQKKDFVKEKKKQQMDVTVAQTRANAEIKNMGAE